MQNSILGIFERVILARNYETFTATSKEQFGYKNEVGSEMAVATANAIQGRAYACCIDFSAAFDRISWRRVMSALEETKLSYAYRRCIFLSFMISTSVFWNGVFVNVNDPTRGVKQGGI